MDSNLLRFNNKSLFTFIDFETFNLCLHGCNNLPWQAAIINVVGDKEVGEPLDIYFKWDTDLKIGEDAARITRFDINHFNRNAIDAKEAFEIVNTHLQAADYIIGHNVLGFDIYLIKIIYDYFGKNYVNLVEKVIDTNCLAKAMHKGFKKNSNESLLSWQYKLSDFREKGLKTSLSTIGKHFGIEHDYDNLHNAIIDLKLNIKVWNKLKFAIEI